MAGFLNKKNRLIDFKLTEFGKNKLSVGKLSFKYYTFSDSSIYYKENKDENKTFKVSTDNHYLPFEVDSLSEKSINKELKLDKIAKYEAQDTVLLNNFLSTKFSLTDYLIKEKYITNSEYINNSYPINFSFRDEPTSGKFNFNSSTLSYPTIKQSEINIENIRLIKHDNRFSHMLKNMFLPPVNISDDSEFLDLELELPDFSFIFKNLSSNNQNQSLRDINSFSRDAIILKALEIINSNKEIHRQEYILHENTTNKSDEYLFEMFEVENEELKKLSFINLGSFFDSKSMKYKKVFLIGKVAMRDQESFNISVENKRKYLTINKDYVFINMFTLVLE